MSKEYANRMIDRVAERFLTAFGSSSQITTKLMAWNIQPNFGVAVEINQPTSEHEANVWVPSIGGKQSPPRFAIYYPATKGRHSNTYATPGLEKGKPAHLFKIHTEDELNEAIDYIKMIQKSPPSLRLAK